MATDYVVKFTGQDNLSGTINQVKKNLEDVGGSTSKLDQIQQKFQKIEQSTAPLKRKLRDLKNLMAQMNMDGLSNTDLFNQMAQQAGTYADALSDASTATSVFANDNFKLEAMAQGLTGIAGAASVATGVMGLLGTENEKVTQAIMKVQSVLAILNGVQAVANVLNKDSAFMLRLKQIRTAACTAATKSNTTALGANTVAETLNNTTTKRGTIFQNAWNVAKAIAKALMGDFTGLLLVGAGALLTYALATNTSKEKTEENTEAIKEAKTEFQSYQEALSNAIGQCVSKFLELQTSWKACKSEQEKNQFIKDNKKVFEEYGLTINTVGDAENVLVNNTSTFVAAINQRAKAMAQFERLKQAWTDSLTALDKLGGEDIVNELLGAGSVLTQAQKDWLNSMQGDDVSRALMVFNNSVKGDDGQLRVTGKGAAAFNRLWMEKNHLEYGYDVETHNQYLRSQKNIQRYSNDLAKSNIPLTTNTRTTTPTQTPKPKEPDYDKGSLEDEKAKLTELQNLLKKTKWESEEAMQQAIQAVRDQAAKVEQMELQLSWEVKPQLDMSDDTITGLTNQINALQKRLKDEVLTPQQRQELVMEIQVKTELRDNLEAQSKTPEVKTISELYGELKSMAADVQSEYDNGLIDKDTAISRVAEINAEIAKLGGKPIKLEFQTNFQTVADQINAGISAIQGIDGVVGSVKNLTQSLKEGANAWDVFMGVVNVASSVLSAITTIIETVNLLSSIHTSTKTAESAATTAATVAEGTKATADAAAIAPATALTTALKLQEAAYMDLAASAYFAAHAFIPFAGFGIATGFVSSMMAAMTAQSAASKALAAFADGGIVSGSTYHGDRILARVNAGEMVLNKTQQANLFKALDSGAGRGSTVTEVKIKGSDLYLALKNYNNKIDKIR